MKEILILGTGCPKCQALAERAAAAAGELGIPYQIKKVTELAQIMAFGVLVTPALVVDGTVKVAGRVPALAELKTMLT